MQHDVLKHLGKLLLVGHQSHNSPWLSRQSVLRRQTVSCRAQLGGAHRPSSCLRQFVCNSRPRSRDARPAPPQWADSSKESVPGRGPPAADLPDEMRQLLQSAADQQQQAEATSSSLRQMVQTLIHAQQLLRGSFKIGAERPDGLSSGLSASTAAEAALQPELAAIKARLMRALSALERLQHEHRKQQEAIIRLQEQLQHSQSNTQASSDAGSNTSMLPGLAAALAGAANAQLRKQHQELADQLDAAKSVEQQLRVDLAHRQQQLQDLQGKMTAEVSFLQATIRQQGARLAQLTQQLQDSRKQLASSKAEQEAAQEQLKQREAELAAQVKQLNQLSDGLAAAQDSSGQMRWELLSKEATLSTLTQQLADMKDTTKQAAAAHADQLQQKDSAINSLLDKLSLLEAASAAEAAWLNDKINGSEQQAAQMQAQLQQLHEQVAQQEEQQSVQHSIAAQPGELSAELKASLRQAVLGALLEQLNELKAAHQEELKQLQQQLAFTAADGTYGRATEASKARVQEGTSSIGGPESLLLQQLQDLVDDNAELAKQLQTVLSAMSDQSQQYAAILAAKDKQLQQQAEQMAVGDQRVQQQAALFSEALSAVKAAEQQVAKAAPAAPVQQSALGQAMQPEPRQQQQEHTEQNQVVSTDNQQQKLKQIEESVSASLQELHAAMTDLHQQGAWAFPTSQGGIDLSVPDVVQHYQQLMKTHLQEGLAMVQLGPEGVSSSPDDISPVSRASSLGPTSLAAADAFVEAYLQLQDRDKALHSIGIQLAAVLRELAQWQANSQAGYTFEGVAGGGQQGQQQLQSKGPPLQAAESTAVLHVLAKQQQVAMKQLQRKVDKLTRMNIQLSEQLTLSRRQAAAAEQQAVVAEEEAATAEKRADALAAQLADPTVEELGPPASAAVPDADGSLDSYTVDLEMQLAVASTELAAARAELHDRQEGSAAAARLQQQLETAAAAAAATTAEQHKLMQRLLELEQSVVNAATAAQTNTQASAQQQAVQQLQEKLAIAEAGSAQQRQELQHQEERHQAAAAADAASLNDAQVRYKQQVAENAVLQDQQQQQAAELRQMAIELHLLRTSEAKLQQQLQLERQEQARLQLLLQQQERLQDERDRQAQDAAITAEAADPEVAKLQARYKQQVAENAVLQDQHQQQAAELRQMVIELQLMRSVETSLQQQLQQQELAHSQQEVLLQQQLKQQEDAHLQQQQQQLEQLQGLHHQLLEGSTAVSESNDIVSTTNAVAPGSVYTSSSSSSDHVTYEPDNEAGPVDYHVHQFNIDLSDTHINMHEPVQAAADVAATPHQAGSMLHPVYTSSNAASINAQPVPAPSLDQHAVGGDVDDSPPSTSDSTEFSDSLQLLQRMTDMVDSRDAAIMQLQQQQNQLQQKLAELHQQEQQQQQPSTAQQSTAVIVVPVSNSDAEQRSHIESEVTAGPSGPAPAAVAHAVAAAATAGIGRSSNGAELLGSAVSMAMLLPLIDELHRAQQAEDALQAAKDKICLVLGLLGATESAILQRHHQALALQKRMWEVSSWRPLLSQAWRLFESEEKLAQDLVLLQRLEDQQQEQQGQPQEQAGQESQQQQDMVQPQDQQRKKRADQAAAAAATGAPDAAMPADSRQLAGSARSNPKSAKQRKFRKGKASKVQEHHHQHQHTQQQPQRQQQPLPLPQLQQQHHKVDPPASGLADLVGWEGDAAVTAATKKCKDKVGQMLARLAARQAELAIMDRHLRRLAAILMAGTGWTLARLQQQLEKQQMQVDKSRKAVRQQVARQQQHRD